MGSMNPFSKMTKADFTLIDPSIKQGKGVKFSDVAGLKVVKCLASCNSQKIFLIFNAVIMIFIWVYINCTKWITI